MEKNFGEADDRRKIRGTVVVIEKKTLRTFLNRVLGSSSEGFSLQIVSATGPGSTGIIHAVAGGEKVPFPQRTTESSTPSPAGEKASEKTYAAEFDWDAGLSEPGAVVIVNNKPDKLYVRSIAFEVPDHGTIHFTCGSWVYPAHCYVHNRVFFSNKAYLPGNTPEPLRHYRERELADLRGTGSGRLRRWDRVYDYDLYDDLGCPDKDPRYARPILGGSKEFPYPRRGRIGSRPPSASSLNVYVPRDERFRHLKMSDFIAYSLKSIAQVLIPGIQTSCGKIGDEFDSMGDVMELYKGAETKPPVRTLEKVRNFLPWQILKELFRTDGERCLRFPLPAVIREGKQAWRTDEEFGREMLAGVNPVLIKCLQVFPPVSNLDPEQFGNQNSSITGGHIEKNLHGMRIDEAMEKNRLFILDHHDLLIPFLRRINSTSSRIYASRTLLFLEDDGRLRPLAIELSLPHPQGDHHGSVSRVMTPSPGGLPGVQHYIWQLAKTHVTVNDSGHHQLISHWLHSHAVMEPFIIATHRNLSVLHPIHKLLLPHFRDTMHINALARRILLNAGGLLEKTVFPARYGMELSSSAYKNWNFMEQALPADLIKRGMAVEDAGYPHGLRLVIGDYPYAVDGLEVWSAIEAWVGEYTSLFYTTDELVLTDVEIQSWWSEVRCTGHGDRKEERWWPEMQTRDDVARTCTIIIWIASAFHAAVNFGQYQFAGFLPNRPAISRRLIPEPGTAEYKELERNPDGALLRTMAGKFRTALGISLIEILSRHSADEVYLGQREDEPNWTSDANVKAALQKFRDRLMKTEAMITARNEDERFKNRSGPAGTPYTLLYPSTSDHSQESGLARKGIPNSISI